RCMPYAADRSKRNRGLASKKWKWLVTEIGTAAVLVTSTTTDPASPDGSAAPGAAAAPARNASRTTASRVPSSKTASTRTSAPRPPGPAGARAGRAPPPGRPGRPRLAPGRQPPAVPRRLAHRVRPQRRGLHDVQPQAPAPPRPGEFGGQEDEQPVPFGL